MRSWRAYHHLITIREATEAWTSSIALLHCATGEVGEGLPEGRVDLQKGASPPAEKDLRAKVQEGTTAGPEVDHKDPSEVTKSSP